MSRTRRESLIENTAVLALGQFIPHAAALITLPICTEMLTQAEYGAYDLINTVVYILNVVVICQIHQAAFRVLIDARGTDRVSACATTAFGFALGPAALSSVVFGMYFRAYSAGQQALLGL